MPRIWIKEYLDSFFNLGAGWGWVEKSMPLPCYPGKETRHPLYRRLDGPQSRSGRVWKSRLKIGFDHHKVQPVASRGVYS